MMQLPLLLHVNIVYMYMEFILHGCIFEAKGKSYATVGGI